ncbi:hypothetical protein SAMN02927921_00338 [Sinomicrobium oceani]|uniref:NADH-quinone oxidoreductase subunit E n=1 Tax=Sinomicrobium oceani TaxID=1150368 RepID=A0A1K1M2S3_9FLAO|nr:hypothetical protein [Sinomicrobium oceani]SFW17451.1 hypothetical protein SAMN02927921_00338 [Sinomicrobium oceani]
MDQLTPVAAIEYVWLFIMCFGCFLVGYFFAKNHSTKVYGKRLDECLSEKLALRESLNKHAQSTFGHQNPSIKARKTRNRKGELHHPKDSLLDFERIGIAEESEKDDLKMINGVGPFIEEKLNSIGIYTFEQISRFREEDMNQVTELIQFFPGRIKRDDWKGQASALKKKKNSPE